MFMSSKYINVVFAITQDLPEKPLPYVTVFMYHIHMYITSHNGSCYNIIIHYYLFFKSSKPFQKGF